MGDKEQELQDEVDDQADMINGLVDVVDELCSLIKKMVENEQPTDQEYDLFQRVVAGMDVTPTGSRGDSATPERPRVLVIGGGSDAMLQFLKEQFPLDDGPLGSVFDD